MDAASCLPKLFPGSAAAEQFVLRKECVRASALSGLLRLSDLQHSVFLPPAAGSLSRSSGLGQGPSRVPQSTGSQTQDFPA